MDNVDIVRNQNTPQQLANQPVSKKLLFQMIKDDTTPEQFIKDGIGSLVDQRGENTVQKVFDNCFALAKNRSNAGAESLKTLKDTLIIAFAPFLDDDQLKELDRIALNSLKDALRK